MSERDALLKVPQNRTALFGHGNNTPTPTPQSLKLGKKIKDLSTG